MGKCSPFLLFFNLKFLNYKSTITHLQESYKMQKKKKKRLHVVPLYITVIFSSRWGFLVGVSISNSQKLIEWMYREVEGYSRPEKHYVFIIKLEKRWQKMPLTGGQHQWLIWCCWLGISAHSCRARGGSVPGPRAAGTTPSSSDTHPSGLST